MSAATCFRCDWQGGSHARVCPRCGAPLYRPAKPEPVRDDDGASHPVPRWRWRLPPGVSIGVALALALAVVFAIDRFPEGTSSPRASDASQDRADSDALAGSGMLVYLAGPPGVGSELWFLDLDGGGAGPGPAVPSGTRELVDLSGAARGWIGIERGRGPRISAAVVRGMQAGADVDGLGHGDLVAWGPGGRSLVFARNGHATGTGCAPVR